MRRFRERGPRTTGENVRVAATRYGEIRLTWDEGDAKTKTGFRRVAAETFSKYFPRSIVRFTFWIRAYDLLIVKSRVAGYGGAH